MIYDIRGSGKASAEICDVSPDDLAADATPRCSFLGAWVRAVNAQPADCDLIVRNAMVVTMDKQRTIYRDGGIAITGTDIAMVGPIRDVTAHYRGKETIDAGGAPVHP